MSTNFKRRVSAMMAFIMLLSVMLSGTNVVAYAAGAKIDVWDFGCVAESNTSLYDNHITADTINGCDVLGTDGKFTTEGEYDFNGLIVYSLKNDRMYCSASNKNAGDNGKTATDYGDGYVSNGMWYSNGTGGEARRFAKLTNVKAGDEVVVYTASSSTADLTVHFKGGEQDDTVFCSNGAATKASFIAKSDGEYKIWYDAASGKPIIHRVVRYPATTVTGTIADLKDVTTSDCTVVLKNTTTDDSFTAVVPAGEDTFSVDVTPGYTYSATLKGVTGIGFTYATKFIDVSYSDVTSGVNATLAVEAKETYELTGEIKGFAKDYDISSLSITLTPDADDVDTVKATLDGTSYSATLDPDVTYTVSLGGVNDYEVAAGGSFVFSNTATAVNDITVDTKATHKASGDITTSDGDTASVTALVFTNLEDGYTYSATLTSNNSYSVRLRDGEYVASVSSDSYTTSTHVSVNGSDVTKDLYFKATTVTAPSVDTSVRDIYVGCDGKVNNFETVGEAFAAAAVMNPQSEAERVTIHVAPGTYRAQISLETPYVSLVKEGTGDVVLTWYYGIGYKYYSSANTGYWQDEADFDKYNKKTPEKWGVATYIKSGAKYFRAEGIIFETSFNKYVTDEEISDGVELTMGESIRYVRTLGANVTSKAATERAAALAIEADGAEFKDCQFIGSQDTLYMAAPVRAYYKNCVIEGNTDYIFGSGNAVFDSCELRFAGYSDSAAGGYITAARGDLDKWTNSSTAFKGYLFRSCSVTNKATDLAGNTMLHTAGYFGRPWDKDATVTYLNTKLESATGIAGSGWTAMSGVDPSVANYKEYNTTYNGQAVDVSGRTSGTVMTSAEASAVKATDYFGDWTPVYYTEGSATVEFTTVPFFSSDVDVLLPATGDTLTVKYSLGDNDSVDASSIDWYRVAEDGTETLIKTTSVATEGGNAYKLTTADLDYSIKAVVTPATVEGVTGTAQSTTTVKAVTKGSGSGVVTARPSGKVAIFLAGDSTVKDYSAGAINNSTNLTEGSWGEFLDEFVTSDYVVRDYAQGGRSSRTFYNGTKEDGSDKYFDMIKSEMMEGDYLFIQFGHNDSSASYADRYVPVGTPDENGVYPATAQTDTTDSGSGTFKWYLQQMVDATKEVGAIPVMVTPVSRMYFDDNGKIYSHHGSNDEYVTITKQVAEENGIECIDLYEYTKNLYEASYADGGLAYPTALFALGEKTHHSKVGGFAIAAQVAYELKTNASLGLYNAITTPKSISSANLAGQTEFRIWSNGKFEAYTADDKGVYDDSKVDTYWTEYVNNQLDAIRNAEADTDTNVSNLGDTDGDGTLTANDAAVTLQFAINNNFDGVENYNVSVETADIDGDLVITANDAAAILQMVLGLAA